jgi:glutamate dehydrogenase (NADP+)
MNTETMLAELKATYAHQPTFLQTAEEILHSVMPVVATSETQAEDFRLLKRLLIPERVISFRVDWMDDQGELQTNLGYRVQYNSALGPYKGGLRFDSSVNEDVLKFLAFEQIFKNALTGLQLGGGKGGSDFNPKGRSDTEIRSFCQAFMVKLHQHIGLEKDVPAGDIGVGAREIGYLYGMFKLITNSDEGVLTGKDELFGGSCQRTEATGHGVVYFAEAMAHHHGFTLEGMTAVVSGAGNVAEYTARKLIDKGVVVLTLSDRAGFIYKPDGLTQVDITKISQAKDAGQNLSDIQIEGASYSEGKVWQQVVADAYFPCATQNEIDKSDAEIIIKEAKLIVEGANMPLTAEALTIIRKAKVLYAPGKASNAGGVSVSGIEMAQNAGHYAWSCERVDEELQKIMQHIHAQCVSHGKGADGQIDYVNGANIAGFKRVMGAMRKLGW